jgi:hypothetical protein
MTAKKELVNGNDKEVPAIAVYTSCNAIFQK